MNTSLIALIFSILGWIAMIFWNVFKGGTQLGSTKKDFENMRDDLDEVRAGLVVSNRMHDENFKDFYKEFVQLRVKVAGYTHDGNGDN